MQADNVIAAEARRLGVTAFRGSCDDVLERFVGAADAVEDEFVIRATADNPAVNPIRQLGSSSDCVRPSRTMPPRKACPMGARLKQSQLNSMPLTSPAARVYDRLTASNASRRFDSGHTM